ncbi:hypothetical protein OZ410_11370 [Robiginitalea sp. M366]|uniref:hypothetical protein n=1 Tax=Robiginitalea aestuariiviva TaxID=3036903 RepID=UPI00240DAB65|nr:hypothetical protein [Robiginitalea aestuariiviva]MDG1572917.1 hypothetical protein [Robiginitalea aestuariiviva]
MIGKSLKIGQVLSLMVGIVVLQACSTDADELIIPEEARLTQVEFQAVMNTDQWTGAADAALAEIYQNGNSASGKSFPACYEVTYSDTGFVAVFNNCVLNGTDNANGTLTVTYDLQAETASFTAVFEAFFVNDVELNGTRTYTLTTGGAADITIDVTSDMTVTLPDERVISETGNKTVAFYFGNTLAESTFTITGSWNISMDNNLYSAVVQEPLTGNFGCGYLVSGVLELSKNGLAITVDLGDGTCDDQAMLTYPNGAQEPITL